MSLIKDVFIPTYDLVAIVQQPARNLPDEPKIVRVQEDVRTEWGIILAVGPGGTQALPFKEGDVVLYAVKNCEKVLIPASLVYIDFAERPSLVSVVFVRAVNIYSKLTESGLALTRKGE